MRLRFRRRHLLVGLVALALNVAVCPTGSVGATTPGPPEAGTTTDTTSTTSTEPRTTTAPPSPTTTSASATGHVVHFLLEDLEDGSRGPYLVPVYRESSPSVDDLETALRLLSEGPSDDETSGIPPISTAIPEGTSLLGVSVDGGRPPLDLSGEFDDGGGSFGMLARLAHVVYTATRLTDADEVVFVVDGQQVTVFSAEGIELDSPQERDDFYDLLLRSSSILRLGVSRSRAHSGFMA